MVYTAGQGMKKQESWYLPALKVNYDIDTTKRTKMHGEDELIFSSPKEALQQGYDTITTFCICQHPVGGSKGDCHVNKIFSGPWHRCQNRF